jgi:hypothetical protein
VWIEQRDADGRMLSQEATDTLIARELFLAAIKLPAGDERRDVLAIIGQPRAVALVMDDSRRHALVQRGGIHSDPLVRLLAFRAWGDRDRRFFELRRDEPVFIDQDGFAITYPKNGVPMIGTAVSEPRDDGTIDVRTDANHRDSTIISRTISKLPWRR